jgi:hypothetical protein
MRKAARLRRVTQATIAATLQKNNLFDRYRCRANDDALVRSTHGIRGNLKGSLRRVTNR